MKGSKKKGMNKSKTKKHVVAKRSQTHQKVNVTMPKGGIPDQETVPFYESVDGPPLQNTGGTGAALHFYVNSLFSTSPSVGMVDPTVTTINNLYNYYRVMRFLLAILFVNMEAFPVKVVLLLSNLDPGTTAITYTLLAMGRLAVTFILAPKGSPGSSYSFKRMYTTRQVVGAGAGSRVDDSFRAVFGNDPTDFIWLGIGIEAVGTNVLTANNGVMYQKDITRYTKCFGSALQTSLLQGLSCVERQIILEDKEIERLGPHHKWSRAVKARRELQQCMEIANNFRRVTNVEIDEYLKGDLDLLEYVKQLPCGKDPVHKKPEKHVFNGMII